MIKIQNLFKQFIINGIKKNVLNNINLEIQRANICAIVGPNGSGKTTLLKIIAGLIFQDSGIIKLQGRVGLAYNSETSFYNQLTVIQNLLFWSGFYYMEKNKIEQIVHKLSLNEFLNTKFESCSSGIKQKMSIARALLSEPDILLIDEPAKSLDFSSTENIHKLILGLNRQYNTTIIFVSHNKEEINLLAKKIIYLKNGEILDSLID